MKIEELPTISVTEVQTQSPQIKGQVNKWRWVGENHFAYLYLPGGIMVEGKFRNVEEATKTIAFVFTDVDVNPKISKGDVIPYFDGYWGERALIVFNNNLSWQKSTFEPSDAIKTYNDGRKEEIPGGWDHEHCEICWATISQKESHNYMQSSQGDIICLECFEKYVKTRSIDFIEEA